ncbi:MAG: HIT domain-containing protein [Dehalococcoidia bacterium]
MSNNNCPFCKMVKHELSPVVVQEDDEILAIMDLYPATPGHVLVLPKRHIEDIYAMPSDTGARIMAVAVSIAKAIMEQLSPSGLNLIQANGAAAGQTISHFHLHMVPRYRDDSVTLRFGHGDTPETIEELEQIASLLRQGLND